MEIHLIDGTYELFRFFFAVPRSLDESGHEIGAVRGVLGSLIGMIESGATHVGVATDHVIESFRNELFSEYKTSAGIDPALLAQFSLFERALEALGVAVWAMVKQEADDALAAAARKASEESRVERVYICSPDKDLAQCVVGDRVVQLDRRNRLIRNEAGVWKRFGVAPVSIPDYLALVGDSADGIPGLEGWGVKSAASVLGRYPHFEDIPKNPDDWNVRVRNAPGLAAVLFARWDDALLYRRLATLVTNAPVFDTVDALLWKGPRPKFETLCRSMRAMDLWERAREVSSGSDEGAHDSETQDSRR